EPAVRVLLERPEVRGVELLPVGAQVAEEPGAQRAVTEDEAPEVADEVLDSEPRGDEVVVRRQVAEVVLEEQLLEAGEGIVARHPLPAVAVAAAVFRGV